MKYYNTITQISVGSDSENPLFGEVIHIKLEDDGGGAFLVLEQYGEDEKTHQVRIGFDEWENICHAVATLTKQQLIK